MIFADLSLSLSHGSYADYQYVSIDLLLRETSLSRTKTFNSAGCRADGVLAIRRPTTMWQELRRLMLMARVGLAAMGTNKRKMGSPTTK